MKKKVIALNFVPKNGQQKLNEVVGCNIYSEICGKLDLEDTVYMSSGAYQEIFGKARKEMCRSMKQLSVVKISNPDSGEVIYRKYEYNPSFNGVGDDMIVLHPASIRELASDEGNSSLVGKEVDVSRGCCFLYFWNHPFHATRISMRLGVISILMAVLSILTSIFI